MEPFRSYIAKNTKSILIALVALAYTGMFFSIPVSNIALALLLLFCLTQTRPKEFLQSIKEHPLPQLMIIAYALLIVGLLYTNNTKTGFFILEKKSSLLLIPILALPLFQRLEVTQGATFRIIGYITFSTSIVLLSIGGFKAWILNDPQAFYFENFTKPLIHYVYYAMYFAIGMLCLLDGLFDSLVKKKRGILILLGLFVYGLSFLLLVASKTGILAFSIASAFVLYKRMESKKSFLLSVFALLVTASVVLYFNETTRNRFTELTQNLSILTRDQLGDWNEEVITGLNMRLLFWKISAVHIWQDNMILWGTGTGDTQDYLDALYTNPKYNRYGYVGWDTHNEWVFTFVQLGLMGVAVLALLYFSYWRKALRNGDLKFIVFLFITLAFSMSESILESNKGIVHFSLFFTLFASAYGQKTSTQK